MRERERKCEKGRERERGGGARVLKHGIQDAK